MSFLDKNGMYHHKPVKADGEPSSRNGWFYTSIAKNLGLPVDNEKLKDLYERCQIDDPHFVMNRLADGQMFPPISPDEVVGLRSLGFKVYDDDYYFAKQPKEIDYEAIGQFIQNADIDNRNQWWEEECWAMIPLTMRLRWADRYYCDKMDGKRTNLFYLIAFYSAAIVKILDRRDKTNTRSARNILWVQLKDMNSKLLIKFIDIKKNFKEYFREGHIFRETVDGQ